MLRILGRRVLALDAEKARIDALPAKLVTQTGPQLLTVFGVGIDTAAALLVTAGDNPGRALTAGAAAGLARVGSPVVGGSGGIGVKSAKSEPQE
jgi:transposase